MNPTQTHHYLQARSCQYAKLSDYVGGLVEKAADDERGLTSTEVAILTFIAVTISSGLGLILWNAVKGRADQISDVEMPVIGDDG